MNELRVLGVVIIFIFGALMIATIESFEQVGLDGSRREGIAIQWRWALGLAVGWALIAWSYM